MDVSGHKQLYNYESGNGTISRKTYPYMEIEKGDRKNFDECTMKTVTTINYSILSIQGKFKPLGLLHELKQSKFI